MTRMNSVLGGIGKLGVAGLFAAALTMPAFAAKSGHNDHIAGALQPVTTTINGTPLSIVVGDEHSYQIFNSAIPGVGQMYPSDSTGTADMGWMVRIGSELFAPAFNAHPDGSATSNLGAYTAFTPQSISPVSGDGSAANPFRVTVTSALGSSGVTASEQISYVNGQNYFQKEFTLTNGGAAAADARIFLGGDIYLAGQDSGVPYREAASSSPGGQDCGSPATYFILFIPQTSATAWTGASYSTGWSQIGAGQLDNALAGTSCIDNGAALQWDRSIAPGSSVTVAAATSFGDVPPIAQFGITAVSPATGAQGATVNVTISGVGFEAATTFGFGSGITLSGLSIVSATSATATLSIDPAAVEGFRDVIATQNAGGLTATLANGFRVTGQGGGPIDPVAPTQLPVSGWGGLALLMMMLAIAGMLVVRRRTI